MTSAIPAGTRARRVAQEGTALLVDLDSRARPGTPGDVPLLRAQLAATLLPAFADAGVTSITLTVADQPLAGAGASSGGGPVTSADAAPLDPETDPAGLAPQALNARGQLSAVARAGPRPVAAGSQVVALAVDADGKRSAQLTGTSPRARVPQLVIAGEAPIDIEQAGPWTSVAFGPASSVWLVGPGIVRVRSGVGRAAVTTTTVTPTVPLRKLVIDPDGVHAVGVTTDGGIVAGLVALPAGGPPVLDLRPVSPGVTDAVDIGLDSTQGSVIVLRKGLPGETPAVKATPSVARVQVAAPQLDVGADLTGAPQPLPAPCGSTLPTSITGRAAVDPLVGCSGGTVVELSHDTWANAGVGLLPSWPLG